ncbi:DUF4174 domain-containing protein [Sphingosinicellaceae bacterium]|nr:DUF4174 domain-containing protein [Sphingosinicellaceae bacterium]
MSAAALIALAAAFAATPAPPATVSQLRWKNRVLLVTAPDAADAAAADQRRIFAAMSESSDDRDLVLVEVLGTAVRGASDGAAGLRRAYHLPVDRFTVILIGKDGGEKLRAQAPLSFATLSRTIDAMPMRRNGER